MSERARVTLWGVRGSIPAPGPETARYGGNTSCVSVEVDGKVLVLDAGSGIRNLGRRLMGGDEPIYLLITHNHWDHIQGFPFFVPAYQPDRKLHLFPFPHEADAECTLLTQMDGSRFPVTPDMLLSDHACVREDPTTFLRGHGLEVQCIPANHPAGAYGIRVDHAGRSLVYIPDNELEPPGEKTTSFEDLVAFCRGVDVLIHDAQYLPEDMPHKHGWGHSVVEQTLALGAAARPKRLLLFHHDPERTDDQVAAIEQGAQAWCAEHCPDVACEAAREGTEILL